MVTAHISSIENSAWHPGGINPHAIVCMCHFAHTFTLICGAGAVKPTLQVMGQKSGEAV